jgi:hypothetical protein
MRYFGGKNGSGVYQRIINQIPPHTLYIEPFLGSGAILRRKRPAAASIAIDLDPGAIAKLCDELPPGCTFILGDALRWLEQKGPTLPATAFVYADPPYLICTRRSHHWYRHEFGSVFEHELLLEILVRLPCPVMLSGYPSDLYRKRLVDWRVDRFEAMTSGGTPATECLWMNYPEPRELHDYRYLGKDFREREKFARQRRRWITRLAAMDRFQRLALAAAIAEPDPHAGTGDGRREAAAVSELPASIDLAVVATIAEKDVPARADSLLNPEP